MHCGQHPSLCGAMVLVAMAVRMIVVMVTTVAAAATAIQEVALPRWSNATGMCDGNKARVYMADNAGAGTATEQFACMQAALWGRIKA